MRVEPGQLEAGQDEEVEGRVVRGVEVVVVEAVQLVVDAVVRVVVVAGEETVGTVVLTVCRRRRQRRLIMPIPMQKYPTVGAISRVCD